MAPPTWLPATFSHHNHPLYVTAQQSHMLPDHNPSSARQYHMLHDNPSPPLPEFTIKLNLSVDFLSENRAVTRSLRGLSMSKTFPIVCDFLISKVGEPTQWSREVIFNMISHVSIPFPPEKIHWEGQQLHQVMSRAMLNDEHDIVEFFLQFLCCIRTDPYNKNRNVLPVNLNMEKHIIVPEREFERCVSKYDEQKSLDDVFEMDSGLLVEALEEATLNDMINELSPFTLEGNSVKLWKSVKAMETQMEPAGMHLGSLKDEFQRFSHYEVVIVCRIGNRVAFSFAKHARFVSSSIL
ncbi:unnamed protein product [Ilex paraguariensis]|uniref:Uncharacterized protein n=1 Tax=Ilex paraguariensis TaxID=185542 RepID=A0ABC8SQA7_9AQUA